MNDDQRKNYNPNNEEYLFRSFVFPHWIYRENQENAMEFSLVRVFSWKIIIIIFSRYDFSISHHKVSSNNIDESKRETRKTFRINITISFAFLSFNSGFLFVYWWWIEREIRQMIRTSSVFLCECQIHQNVWTKKKNLCNERREKNDILIKKRKTG